LLLVIYPFMDRAVPSISPLSLHDALPISRTRTIAQRGDVACVQIVHDTVAVAYDTESDRGAGELGLGEQTDREREGRDVRELTQDRKSTRLNSSHVKSSNADFCLKKKKPQ